MMLTTQAITLNRLSLSESHTNLVISDQLQKTLRVTFGYLQTSLNSLILSKSAIGVCRESKHEQYWVQAKKRIAFTVLPFGITQMVLLWTSYAGGV